MTLREPAPALSRDVLQFFRALADEPRLAIVRLLVVGDLRSGEIGERLHLPANALAYHLKRLRALGLLRDRRSSADARDVYHHLDLDRLATLYAEAGDLLHPGVASSVTSSASAAPTMRQSQASEQAGVNVEEQAVRVRPLRVLFLCTHNSARSQLAEGIMRRLGGDLVEAYSAGSEPTEVHPETIAILRELGADPARHTAKLLKRYRGESFDYVITVCDRVREICPAFTGDPAQAHWSYPDPLELDDPEQLRKMMRTIATELQTRIRYLLLLPHPATGERLPMRS